MSGVFVRNNTGWNVAFKSWGGTLGRYMSRKERELLDMARLEAPSPVREPNQNRTRINYSTGNLLRHIKTSRSATSDGDLEFRVIANVKYAKFVHEPTRPHLIRPTQGHGYLVFFWRKRGGQPVFARQVMHPGTKGNPFLVRAARQVF